MIKESLSGRNQAAINCAEWQLAAAQDLTDLFMPRNAPSIERLEFMKIAVGLIERNTERLLKAWKERDAE